MRKMTRGAVLSLVVTLLAIAIADLAGAQPPPGQVVVDTVRLNFKEGQYGTDIPGDGVAGIESVTTIYWHMEGSPPPPPRTTPASWNVIAGPGRMDPPSRLVTLTANPHGEQDVFYRQPVTAMPTSSDVEVHASVAAGGKMGEASFWLRGVALEMTNDVR